ncbi:MULTISPECIES: class I SAM-dependent methyltransferase [Pontibacillus]|uniref:Methyltransferase domain-containing protein n=1 Tax=Pontibacillus chungwhensis TaxID=265426 RepID=A0ABY8UYQ7_9BACI|nr:MULTISPECIES: class I SAM-dependent methyltransferase [Pontibacillus]MCD5323411.1 methyltransferase domain-containing protein [Pontibacillus sp. HN14]WIF96791.1 methyltransferase domain-containing protein [Pontibacillus chungwhensis]
MTNHYLDLLAYFGIGGAHPGGFELSKQIFNGEKLTSDLHVLDLGCGTGQSSEYIRDTFGCEVTGIDQHPIMIQKANERQADVTFLEGDAEDLPFPDHSFDFIFTESTIAFTDMPRTLEEIRRVLTPKGTVLFLEMTAEHPIPDSLKKQIMNLYHIQAIYLESEWKEELNRAGFTNIECLNIPSNLNESALSDMNLSPNIPESLYDLWDQHAELVEISKKHLGFRTFRCHLG